MSLHAVFLIGFLLVLYVLFAVEVGRFLAGCQPPPYDQERD